jgi:Reverse transcriptase (RNA-dependent DNA polymerase)
MPVLVMKKCPIVRTALHKLIVECWRQRNIPQCWKEAMSVLIYKKGDTADVANFRPITLQPIFYKVLSAVYRNRLYGFLSDNDYIDTHIQKGFWPKCDGISEHPELLTHIMKNAKRTQRSIVISLLDLRNAFGEVSHQLIRSSLQYHHVPSGMIQMFSNIYDGSRIRVAVNKECTQAITVGRGVLQGDPSSPLLFNLCFNSLMRTLTQPKYKRLGYLWGTNGNIRDRSWMQFADDAVVIAGNDKNGQVLLNVFNAWCTWAGMQVRADKCCSFAMRKQNAVYEQYKPVLTVGADQIPAVEIGGDFKYLGKIFNADTSVRTAEIAVVDKLRSLLSKLNSTSLKPQTKLRVLKLAIYPRISYELKVYDFAQTFIKNELDAMVYYHIR